MHVCGADHQSFSSADFDDIATPANQGCSTLWDDKKSEQIVDAGEGGAVAVLAERAGAVGLEDEGETAQAGEHAGIGADARAVFAARPPVPGGTGWTDPVASKRTPARSIGAIRSVTRRHS